MVDMLCPKAVNVANRNNNKEFLYVIICCLLCVLCVTAFFITRVINCRLLGARLLTEVQFYSRGVERPQGTPLT